MHEQKGAVATDTAKGALTTDPAVLACGHPTTADGCMFLAGLRLRTAVAVPEPYNERKTGKPLWFSSVRSSLFKPLIIAFLQ